LFEARELAQRAEKQKSPKASFSLTGFLVVKHTPKGITAPKAL
jgi:hypothetical protein